MGKGNPQIEDGYTRIANELFEVFARTKSINASQFRICFFVMRNTYGYQQKAVNTTYSNVANATSMSRRNAIREIKTLSERQVVSISSLDQGISLSINKHYRQWQGVTNPSLVSNPSPSDEIDTGGGVKSVTDIRKKEKEKKYTPVVPKLSEVLTDIANAYRETTPSCGKIREPSGWITTKSARVSNLKARMHEARLQVRESGNLDSERIGNHPERIVGLFRIYFRWLEDQQRDRMNQRDYTPNVGVTFDSAMRASGTWQKFLDLWETGGLDRRLAA